MPRTQGVQPQSYRRSRYAAYIAPRFPGLPRRRGDLIAVAMALFGLFFFSGSLVVPLTPAGATSSPMVQLLGLSLGMMAFIGLALRDGAFGRTIGFYWPVVVPVALAFASMAWSVEPSLSLRRVLALAVVLFFGLWLVERFARQGTFALFAGAAVLITVINVAVAIAVPSMGVHPPVTELGEANPHAGAWRGLFDHKNDFGRMMALCASVLWIAAGTHRQWRLVCGGALALAYLGVAGSTSGQAAFLSVSVPATLYAVYRLRAVNPARRAMVLILAVPTLITGWFFSKLAFVFVLGLLGKDPTLTGRTEIWAGVLQALQGNMLLGGGFGSGWELVGERLFILTGISVGHAHNGYLDLVTDLGVLGLVAMVSFYVVLLVLAVRAYFSGRAAESALLAFAVAVFALIGNWAASFMLLHNSLYWILPVASFATMRHALRRPAVPRAAQMAPARTQRPPVGKPRPVYIHKTISMFGVSS